MNTSLPLDLRKLRHAVVLSEVGTFARASRELHITQSALTRSIQALEGDLGIQLFERLTSGVRPTVLGQTLLVQARSLLLQANGLRQDALLYRDAKLGKVNFGVGPMLVTWLAPALSSLAQQAPRLEVRVEIEPVYRLQEMLLAEQIEFFVADVTQLPKDQRLAREPLGAMDIGYFVRTGHPLSRRRALDIAELRAYPLISTGFRSTPAQASPRSEAAHDALGWISCENLDTLKAIAQQTDGVLLAAVIAVQAELRERLLVHLPVRELADWVSDVRVVALAGRQRSPSAQRIIEALKILAGKIHSSRTSTRKRS